MPRISAAAILPVRYGSSEKYSKFLPHRGLRLMFIPGPRSTLTPSAMASFPSPSPTCCARSSSQLLQTVAEEGKQVAGTDGFSPRWSPSPDCLRMPLGPSDIKIEGIPSRSKFQDSHSLFPDRNAAFSSAVILLMISACFIYVSSLAVPCKKHITLRFHRAV